MKSLAPVLVASAVTVAMFLVPACGALKPNGFPDDSGPTRDGTTSDGMAPVGDASAPDDAEIDASDASTADASDASTADASDASTADASDASIGSGDASPDAPVDSGGPWILVTSEPRISTMAAGPNEQIWAVGTTPWTKGSPDKTNYQLVYGGASAIWMTREGGGIQVSVAPDNGVAWVVGTAGVVFYYDPSLVSFEPISWTPPMSTLSVGPNGQIWAIGSTQNSPGNEEAYALDLNGDAGWKAEPGWGVQVSVAPDTGVAWIVDWAGVVYEFVDGGLDPVQSPSMTCIAVGPGGILWGVGGTPSATGDMPIYSSHGGNNWNQEPGGAIMITVTPDTGVPWIVNAAGSVFVHE